MNVVIKDKIKFDQINEKILQAGLDKLQVLSDFDRTLTYGLVDGKKSSSLLSLFEKSCKFGEEYNILAKALFDKYYPIEVDLSIPLEERKKEMIKWWSEVYELFIKYGLNRNDLESVIDSSDLKLREGVFEFLQFLKEKNIPLIIFSATGCGEMVEMFLRKNNCNFPNIYYIVNKLNWDDNGKAVSVCEPIIHSLNKDETVISDFPEIFSSVKNRDNGLLLGDNIGDLGMAQGFNFINLLKIGFLNFQIEKDADTYANNFDAVVEGDGDFSFVRDIFK